MLEKKLAEWLYENLDPNVHEPGTNNPPWNELNLSDQTWWLKKAEELNATSFNRTVAEHRHAKAEVAEMLIGSVDFENSLVDKTNKEIADLVLNHVWSEMNMFSPQAVLVDVAIQRLSETKETP